MVNWRPNDPSHHFVVVFYHIQRIDYSTRNRVFLSSTWSQGLSHQKIRFNPEKIQSKILFPRFFSPHTSPRSVSYFNSISQKNLFKQLWQSLVSKTNSGTPNNTNLNNFVILNKVFKNHFEIKNFEIKILVCTPTHKKGISYSNSMSSKYKKQC